MAGSEHVEQFVNHRTSSIAAGAAALVHVSAIESFGLVVAEALARNLKFIGFTSGGVADIVENVEGAEGFADGDWAGLKAAITRWVRAGHPRPATAAATMRERYHPAGEEREKNPQFARSLAVCVRPGITPGHECRA